MSDADDGVVLRHAVTGDADAIGDLLYRAWRTHYAALLPERFWASVHAGSYAARIRERLVTADPAQRAVVACAVTGGIIGWALCGPSRAASAGVPPARAQELYQLYVGRPGLGLGERLLDAVLPAGAPAELWVFEANESAQRFYRRHGFAPDGHRHVYRPELDGGVPEVRLVR